MTEGELRRLAAAGSTLAERLSGAFRPLAGSDPAVAERRLARWRSVVANGDPERFARRLAQLDGEGERLSEQLGEVELTPEAALPAWVHEVAELLAAVAAAEGDLDGVVLPGRPVLFEELIAPLVLEGRRRLAAAAGGALDRFASPARARLERGLLIELSELAAGPLTFEFSVFRASRRSSLARRVDRARGDHHRELYHAFVGRMLDAGLEPLAADYPVLARLWATALGFWVERTAELARRLDGDAGEIARRLRGGAPLPPVTAVDAGLSDPHNRGRTVAILGFDDGWKLVYKPKDLRLEAAWSDLVGWLAERGAPDPLRGLRVWPREGYGWAEYVEARPCRDREEVRRYYRRAGALVCLVYLLEGNDCHLENLIAAGDQPVLIDVETLFHPRPRPLDDRRSDSAPSVAGDELWSSVLRTGLLPSWLVGTRGRSFDISGFGGFEEQETHYHHQRWQGVNSDALSLSLAERKVRPQRNVPLLDGEPAGPRPWVEELVAGFCDLHRFLGANRRELTAPGGPLAAFAGLPTRFVFRASRNYAGLLGLTREARFLRRGIDRSLELEAMSAVHGRARDGRTAALLALELEALERLDLPVFEARTDDDALRLPGGGAIDGFFLDRPYDRALERLEGWDEADLERQVGFIRASFFSRLTAGVHGGGGDGADQPGAETPAAPAAVPARFAELCLERAVAIGRDLAGDAIRSSDGSATWIGLEILPEADRYQFQPAGPGLYGGVSGIALFLGALARVAGDRRARDLALAAVAPVRREIADTGRRLPTRLGIGLGSGLGSLVYSWALLAELLDEPALLTDAEAAAERITDERIAADDCHDLVSGAAGAILALLALDRRRPSAAVRERALRAGEHLLEARRELDGVPVWAPSGRRPWTGLSHGVAGIALALARLAEAAGDRRFAAAAEEALTFERRRFDPEAGNWRDLRFGENGSPPRFTVAWCHGATGIGLARLAMPARGGERARSEIEAALTATLRQPLTGLDHLCCGHFGRIELLWTAAAELARPELATEARARAAAVLERAERRGAFELATGLPPGVRTPGFFQGTSGIGYGLLRFARPRQVPPVLMWR